jgi:hypothetical protein
MSDLEILVAIQQATIIGRSTRAEKSPVPEIIVSRLESPTARIEAMINHSRFRFDFSVKIAHLQPSGFVLESIEP